MRLTAKQRAARTNSIGGSDAPAIMRGEWLQLWQEKTGRRSSEDLSDVLPVQMGHWTEPYNIKWFERKTGRVVHQPKETQYHPLLPYLHANLDGEVQLDEGMAVFQAKHVNPFVSLEDVAEDYYAQLHHEMEVSGYERAALSVFFGNTRWEWVLIQRDEAYTQELLRTEAQFWDHVKSDTPPPDRVGVRRPVDLSKLKTVRMHDSNQWRDLEETWRETIDAALKNQAAVEQLKELVPEDVGLAYGQILCAARTKTNALYIREPLKTDLAKIERHEARLKEKINEQGESKPAAE